MSQGHWQIVQAEILALFLKRRPLYEHDKNEDSTTIKSVMAGTMVHVHHRAPVDSEVHGG